MFPACDPVCWRCSKEEIGDMMHIWSTCPKLQALVVTIYYEINSVLKIPLDFSPDSCLSHVHLKLNKQDTVLLNSLLVRSRLFC